jgi:hypothetical protein
MQLKFTGFVPLLTGFIDVSSKWCRIVVGLLLLMVTCAGTVFADATPPPVYFAQVGCLGSSSTSTTLSASTPQTATQGCYNAAGFAYANAVAEAGNDYTGSIVQVNAGGAYAVSYWLDNVTISNTGLPSGTPLTVDLETAVVGTYSYSLPVNGSSVFEFDIGVGVNHQPADYQSTYLTFCGPDDEEPSNCIVSQTGDNSIPLSAFAVMDTSVGSEVALQVVFNNAVQALGGAGASLYADFIDPVQVVGLQVIDDDTGQTIPNAVLVGSNGPYLLPNVSVPEPNYFVPLAGMAFIVMLKILAQRRRSLAGQSGAKGVPGLSDSQS